MNLFYLILKIILACKFKKLKTNRISERMKKFTIFESIDLTISIYSPGCFREKSYL